MTPETQQQLVRKPELVKDREYDVQLYPTNEVVFARYLGKAKLEGFGEQNVFSGDNYYFLVDNHWMTQEGEVITHNSCSSHSIGKVEKRDVNYYSRLIKMLESMGEKI